jgi:hypothetical protein
MFWINLIPLEINILRFVFLKKKRFPDMKYIYVNFKLHLKWGGVFHEERFAVAWYDFAAVGVCFL